MCLQALPMKLIQDLVKKCCTLLFLLVCLFTTLLLCRLHVVSGLQRRRLSAAGSRSSARHQPCLTGNWTQLQADDLPQHLSEHRQTLFTPADSGRQRGGLQVQSCSQDKQTQTELGPQHRRIQVQPGPSDPQTQTQLRPQHRRIQAESRAEDGEAQTHVQPQYRQTPVTQTEPHPQCWQTSFSLAQPRGQFGQKQAESVLRPRELSPEETSVSTLCKQTAAQTGVFIITSSSSSSPFSFLFFSSPLRSGIDFI